MSKDKLNNKIYNCIFCLDSKEEEEEYRFFFFSSKFKQTKNIILVASIIYFALGFFDLFYSNIGSNVFIPIKLLIVIFGLVLVYSNILSIQKVNIYVHLFFIMALLGITVQMYYSSDPLFFLFYTVGLVSVFSVSILLSTVKILYTLSSSIIISTIYILLLNDKITNNNMLYGHIFLILIVLSVVAVSALINELSNRENYKLLKQVEQNTNNKIAAEIEINKNSIIKLKNLGDDNMLLKDKINELKSKKKLLISILDNDAYDKDTKLKIITSYLHDIDIINIYDIDKETEQINTDISKNLKDLKTEVEINESIEIGIKQFDLNQMLSDIFLVFKFSTEKKNFIINNITNKKIEINTDEARLKQIFISLVNHMYDAGANVVTCTYHLDENNNISFKFSTKRYINDKLEVNKLLVPAYLAKLGGKFIDLPEEENTIAFIIPRTQPKITETNNNILNFKNKSVLIIDDDKENLSYIEFVVKNSKAKIYKATNGVEALEIFKESNHELQIVIMDINMPGLDGNEAAKYMKEINPSIPILLVTAYSYYSDININADKILIKPFTPKVLIDNISELVN